MNIETLATKIETTYDSRNMSETSGVQKLFSEFLQALNAGKIRIAEKVGNDWKINHWVKNE